MKVNNFTVEQVVSLALLVSANIVDYLELTDFDYFDWLEWGWLHRN